MNPFSKRWIVLLTATLLIASIAAACGGKSAVSPSPGHTGSVSTEQSLPATKEFTLQVGGKEEKRTGTLAQGQGFSLYVLDGLHFEPMLSLLTLDADRNHYARIEKLPSGYSLEEVIKTAHAELSKVGEVREVRESEMNPLLGGASLLLTGSNDKLSQEVIIKDVEGTGFRIYVNLPNNGANDPFEPPVYASISSIVGR